ncbi:MAG: DUF3073 domain-containing protein [Actinomycetota bacterium]|nr:DUF3073 domain-containing protein [Actinomycetota bacterium]
MGRGRAKAKQTKVARDLKYRTYETDFERLQREMREQAAADSGTQDSDTDDADGDTYADPDDDADPSQRP